MAVTRPNLFLPRTATVQPTEMDLEMNQEAHKIGELQVSYEGYMKDLSPGKRHTRVIVVLLYWLKEANSWLDAEEEVEKLREVFDKNFNYKVYKCTLNCTDRPGKSSTVLLQKYISDAVYEIEGPNSLLIIYYAGHGNPGPARELRLTGGNLHPESTKFAGIIWDEAEILVRNAKSTDVLLIFDCCFASTVRESKYRQPYSIRNFEFFGASNALTRKPGKHSFTSALIWALKKLATDPEGFTTSQLRSTLQMCPDFPREEQVPILEERKDHTLRRLQLVPLPHGDDANNQHLPRNVEEDRLATKYGLCLQFTFRQLMTKDDVERMCAGLKAMIESGELKATQINWKGLHRQHQSVFDMPPLALQAARQLLRKHRARSSVGGQQSLQSLGQLAPEFNAVVATGRPEEEAIFDSPSEMKDTEDNFAKDVVSFMAANLDKKNLLVVGENSPLEQQRRIWQRRWMLDAALMVLGSVAGVLIYRWGVQNCFLRVGCVEGHELA